MTDIVKHDAKFNVVADDGSIEGVFFTRKGALAFIAETNREEQQGPRAKARRALAIQLLHHHDPIVEGLVELNHVHEFETVDHAHPGYGPGSFSDEEDENS